MTCSRRITLFPFTLVTTSPFFKPAVAPAARGTTSAGTGGTFDSEGNFQELSTGQRFAAGGEALVTFADLSGATGKVTDAVMGSGGNVKRFGRANSSELSGFGETAFEQGGRGLQRLNIANDQFGRALSNSGTFQAVNTAADFAGVKPPTSITGAIKKTGNAASTGLGNAIDSDGNSGGGGAAGSF